MCSSISVPLFESLSKPIQLPFPHNHCATNPSSRKCQIRASSAAAANVNLTSLESAIAQVQFFYISFIHTYSFLSFVATVTVNFVLLPWMNYDGFYSIYHYTHTLSL